MRIVPILLLSGCMTATNLAENFVEPLEDRLGDPASPASGTIEARLAALEDQIAQNDASALQERVSDLEAETEELFIALSNLQGQLDDVQGALRGASSVELWGIGERAGARVFNPDGSAGRSWTFPLDRDSPAVLRLELFDCRAVLLNIDLANFRDVGDRAGLNLGMDNSLAHPVRVGLAARRAEGNTTALSTQVWVPNEGGDRIRVRTLPGLDVQTTATVHHIGCIR